MTQHLHGQFVEGCYRCDLGRDEVARAFRDPEYRVVYVLVAEDGAVELYDEHNDLIGWHRNDVKPFGADDAPPQSAAGRVEVSQTDQATKETK